MRQEVTTPAVLLRKVDYREADRIVTLLTPSHGCVSAIALGARRSQRRFAGALEPFSVLDVELVRARDGWFRLSAARLSRGCVGILADLRRMNAAGAALDVLRRLVAEQDPDGALYDETVAFLGQLDGCPDSAIAPVRLAFVARVVALCGWAPDLDKCGGCGRRPGSEQAAGFDPARGHLVCRACGGGALQLSAAARRVLSMAAAAGLSAVLEPPWDPRLVAETEAALSAVVRVHAG